MNIVIKEGIPVWDKTGKKVTSSEFAAYHIDLPSAPKDMNIIVKNGKEVWDKTGEPVSRFPPDGYDVYNPEKTTTLGQVKSPEQPIEPVTNSEHLTLKDGKFGCRQMNSWIPSVSPIEQCHQEANALNDEIHRYNWEQDMIYRQSSFYQERLRIERLNRASNGLVYRSLEKIENFKQQNICPLIQYLTAELNAARRNDLTIDYISADVVYTTATNRWGVGLTYEVNLDRFGQVFVGVGGEADLLALDPRLNAAQRVLNAGGSLLAKTNSINQYLRQIPANLDLN